MHACSVGEVESCIPLIHALKHSYPNYACLVTTTTPTGSSRVIDEFGDGIQHVYLPYDVGCVVNTFLNRFKPKIAIIVEKEIWPNLFLQCKKKGIPVVLVNAMLSNRSFRQYQNWHQIFKPVFSSIGGVGVQSSKGARQFECLGVYSDRISVTGNLKFQRKPTVDDCQQSRKLKQSLFGNRPIWIAASTHDNEEALILSRIQDLQSNIPDLLLIIAPRHPNRGSIIERYCQKTAISYITRSSGKACLNNEAVFLLDTLGELTDFYGLSDVAFVGGSLVDLGCHNLLEPAAWGVPVVFGSSIFNCEEIASHLVANNAAKSVNDVDDCIAKVKELFLDQTKRRLMTENAKNYIDKNQGQLAKTIEIIRHEIDKPSEHKICT